MALREDQSEEEPVALILREGPPGFQVGLLLKTQDGSHPPPVSQ